MRRFSSYFIILQIKLSTAVNMNRFIRQGELQVHNKAQQCNVLLVLSNSNAISTVIINQSLLLFLAATWALR